MAVIKPKLSQAQKANAKSRAEIALYEAFQKQLAGDEWLVLFNARFVEKKWAHSPPIDGEIDFLVVHPEWGALMIEVKGGAIAWRGETLYSNEHVLDLDHQLENNKFGALARLGRRGEWDPTLKHRFFHAAAFPDCACKNDPMPAWLRPEFIIDRGDLADIETRLRHIFRFWSNGKPMDADRGKRLRFLIEDSFMPAPPRIRRCEDVEKKILELTEDQERIIRVITAGMRRAAISGGAGSGKTLLALMKSLELASQGLDVLLLVFNRPLREFLQRQVRDNMGRAGTQKTPRSVLSKRGRLDVMTFHELCGYVAKQNQTSLPPMTEANRGRYFDAILPELLFEQIGARKDLQYDAVIVDEGQDLLESWWIGLDACLRHGPESFLYVFFDDNQQLRSLGGAIPKDLPVFPLTDNIRNTSNIHQVLTRFYQGARPYIGKGPLGFLVESLEYGNPEGMKKNLATLINDLHVKAGVPFNHITVLTPKNLAERSALGPLLRTSFPGGFSLAEICSTNGPKPDESLKPSEVGVSSIHRFKGLETPVGIVVELDEDFLARQNWRELCYVGLSRAKTMLFLLGCKQALRQILNNESPTGV